VLAGKTPLMAPTTGQEVGVRTDIVPKAAGQVAVFQEDFSSELAFDEDQGQDEATAPSRRQGVEVSAEYRPVPLGRVQHRPGLLPSPLHRLAGGSSQLRPRWTVHRQRAIVHRLVRRADRQPGTLYGGLQWRDLGPYPVSDGDQFPQDKGYSEVNLDAGYRVNSKFKIQLSIFNLFNTRANGRRLLLHSRLPGEPAADVTDFQVHPLEPISARLGATATFLADGAQASVSGSRLPFGAARTRDLV